MGKKLNTSEAILGTTETEKKKPGRKPYVNPDEKKAAQTTLLFRPTTKENLKELAWRKRISLNELVTQICEEYLEKHFEA